MEKCALPRELQYIINGIIDKNNHVLEWEVFGNTADDMRVVLTWHCIASIGERFSIDQSKSREGFEEKEIDPEGEVGAPLSKKEVTTTIVSGDVCTLKKERGGEDSPQEDKKKLKRGVKIEEQNYDVYSNEYDRIENLGVGEDEEKEEEDSCFNDGGRDKKELDQPSTKGYSNALEITNDAEELLNGCNEDDGSEDDSRTIDRGKGRKDNNEAVLRRNGDREGKQMMEEYKINVDGEAGNRFEEEEGNHVDEEVGNRVDEEEGNRVEKRRRMGREETSISVDKINSKGENPEREDEMLEEITGRNNERFVKVDGKQCVEDKFETKNGKNEESLESETTNRHAFEKQHIGSKLFENTEGDNQSCEVTDHLGHVTSNKFLLSANQYGEMKETFIEDKSSESDDNGTQNEMTKRKNPSSINEIERIGNSEKERREELENEMRRDKNIKRSNSILLETKDDALKLLELKRDQFKMAMEEAESNDLDIVCATVTEDVGSCKRNINDNGEFEELLTSNRNIVDSNKENLKFKRKHASAKGNGRLRKCAVIRQVEPVTNTKGWENCLDCRYNDFCDDVQHKDEYRHLLLEDAKLEDNEIVAECKCNVCRGGAVHNGCVYREIIRLKTDYLIFDTRNYCYCIECIPFRYRRICLRQELRLMRSEGNNSYYRLTNYNDDGIIKKQSMFRDDSLESNSSGDNIDHKMYAEMKLDDIEIEVSLEDKASFWDCIDCQCNGFCDNIRHKKIYLMILRIDYEDFAELADECGCFVCEFKGAAHSGCIKREIKRLTYDFLLYDQRNLCSCYECVPFKYRRVCLRQEMKMLLKHNDIDLYPKLL